MRDLLPTIFFLSAERVEESPGYNEHSTGVLATELTRQGLPYKQVEGYFAGHKEATFLIVGAEHEAAVFCLGVLFKQGAYVRCDGDRNAFLVDLGEGGVEHLGTFRKVTSEQAKRWGAYTFDPETGQYWAATNPTQSTSEGNDNA